MKGKIYLFLIVMNALIMWNCGGGGGVGGSINGNEEVIYSQSESNSNETNDVNSSKNLKLENINGVVKVTDADEDIYVLNDKFLVTSKGIYEIKYENKKSEPIIGVPTLIYTINWPNNIVVNSIKLYSTSSGELNVYVLTEDGSLFRCNSEKCYRQQINKFVSDYVLSDDELIILDKYGNIFSFKRNGNIHPVANGFQVLYYEEEGTLSYKYSLKISYPKVIYFDPYTRDIIVTDSSSTLKGRKNYSNTKIVISNLETQSLKSININTANAISSAIHFNNELLLLAGKKIFSFDLSSQSIYLKYTLPGLDANYIDKKMVLCSDKLIIPVNPSISFPASYLEISLDSDNVDFKSIYANNIPLGIDQIACQGDILLIKSNDDLPILIQQREVF